MATITRETLVAMLGSNFTLEKIAECLQVTPNALQEAIVADPSLAEETERYKTYIQTDRSLDKTENLIARKLEQLVKFETDINKMSRALAVVNGAKRRSLGEQYVRVGDITNNTQINVVQLSLPKRMELSFEKNIYGEVTKVNDKELVSMPAQQLLRQIKREDNIVEDYDDLLPKPLNSAEIKELL